LQRLERIAGDVELFTIAAFGVLPISPDLTVVIPPGLNLIHLVTTFAARGFDSGFAIIFLRPFAWFTDEFSTVHADRLIPTLQTRRRLGR